MPMKLKDKISWLMGSVQRSLSPIYDECLETPLHKRLKRQSANIQQLATEVPRWTTRDSRPTGMASKVPPRHNRCWLANQCVSPLLLRAIARLPAETSIKATYFYDLMNAAYDAARIDEISRQFNHIPIIDKNGRGKEVIPMAPHEVERYKGRSVAKRANSRLKEDFGANKCHGPWNNKSNNASGCLALSLFFADQLIWLLG